MFGSGQEETRGGLGCCGDFTSSQAVTFSQPSGGSLRKQQLVLGSGEEFGSAGSSPSLWRERGNWKPTSVPSPEACCWSGGASTKRGLGVETPLGEQQGEGDVAARSH